MYNQKCFLLVHFLWVLTRYTDQYQTCEPFHIVNSYRKALTIWMQYKCNRRSLQDKHLAYDLWLNVQMGLLSCTDTEESHNSHLLGTKGMIRTFLGRRAANLEDHNEEKMKQTWGKMTENKGIWGKIEEMFLSCPPESKTMATALLGTVQYMIQGEKLIIGEKY